MGVGSGSHEHVGLAVGDGDGDGVGVRGGPAKTGVASPAQSVELSSVQNRRVKRVIASPHRVGMAPREGAIPALSYPGDLRTL